MKNKNASKSYSSRHKRKQHVIKVLAAKHKKVTASYSLGSPEFLCSLLDGASLCACMVCVRVCVCGVVVKQNCKAPAESNTLVHALRNHTFVN